MKITSIETTPVFIPYKATTRWHWGSREGSNRLIIQVHTDAGLVGLGETTSGAQQVVDGFLAPLVAGEDPSQIERFMAKVYARAHETERSISEAMSGVEMALWDLLGKECGRPVCDLAGGRYRDPVPLSLWIFFRYPGECNPEGELTPERVAEFCAGEVARYGFGTVKLKFGVMEPEVEMETLRLVRKALGTKVRIRIDPNAGWTIGTAMRMMAVAEECQVQYVEDPVSTHNFRSMARLRSTFRVPICGNGVVWTTYDLAKAIMADAIDIALADVSMQGGIYNSKKLAAVAEAFGVPLAIHCSEYLGITISALLHLAASTPQIKYAMDTYYPYLTDDVITGGLMDYSGGAMKVPSGPGLGVQLDPEKVGKYHELFNTYWLPRERKHAHIPGYHPDWRRPEYVPVVEEW